MPAVNNRRNARRTPLWPALVGVLIVAVVAFAPNAAAEYFNINTFQADIEIHGDRTVHVTERIEVTFNTARHGIFRDIPYKYRDALGDRHVAPIDVESIVDEQGHPRHYVVSHQGNVVDIKIGSANSYVSGRQVYVIRYTVKNILLFLEDRDELYWNVTGNQWPVTIDSVSATVRLATKKTSSHIYSSCYTGRSRSTEHYCTAETVGSEVLFNSTRGLATYEGFTVAVGWDKGIIAPPSKWEQMVYDYNLNALWVMIIPLVVLVFMFIHWRSRGRDPIIHEAITVRYEPPSFKGKVLTAAEVGTMIDERVDPRDLSAAIVGLASKGYLKIREIDDKKLFGLINSRDYELTKTKPADESLTQFETYLFTKLFLDRGDKFMVSELKNEFYKYIPTLYRTMYSGLTLRGFFRSSPANVRRTYQAAGIVIMALGFVSAITFTPMNWVYTVVAGVLSGLIVLLFARAMPAKTRAGVAVLDQIRGFQEFMNRADRDRIERMGPSVFYEYMPYAIALDVTERWAKAFEGLLTEPPNWYVGAFGMGYFSPVLFTSSLNSVTSSLATATYSSPRGSGGGSGGGGFSGGGGGGGGGGSW